MLLAEDDADDESDRKSKNRGRTLPLEIPRVINTPHDDGAAEWGEEKVDIDVRASDDALKKSDDARIVEKPKLNSPQKNNERLFKRKRELASRDAVERNKIFNQLKGKA